MHQHSSTLLVITCCQKQQLSRTFGEDIKMLLSSTTVYDHAVIVHAHEFVDSLDPDIHTESIEGLLMQAIRKLRYHSGTSRGLFESNFSQFQWHNSHKQNVFDCYLQMLCAKCSRLHQNCTTCLLMFSFNTVNQRKCIKWSLLISAVVILPVLKGSLQYISGS